MFRFLPPRFVIPYATGVAATFSTLLIGNAYYGRLFYSYTQRFDSSDVLVTLVKPICLCPFSWAFFVYLGYRHHTKSWKMVFIPNAQDKWNSNKYSYSFLVDDHAQHSRLFFEQIGITPNIWWEPVQK